MLILCLVSLAACKPSDDGSLAGRSNSPLDLSNSLSDLPTAKNETSIVLDGSEEVEPVVETTLTITATSTLEPAKASTLTQTPVENPSGSANTATTPENLPKLPLAVGSDQLEVEKLMDRLFTLGYPLCSDPSTYFGPQTAAVVRLFQKSHALEADGIVGKKTWEMLFSESAKPFQLQAPQRSLKQVMKIDRLYGISADEKFLWGVRWFFDAPSELVKIDGLKGMVVKENPMSDIAKVKDPWGKTIPQSIKPGYVTALDDQIWIAGKTSAGAYEGEPVIQALLPSGKPSSDPIFFRYVSDPVAFGIVSLVNDGKTAWAAVNTPFTMLYELNAKTSGTGTRISLFDVSEARSVAMGKDALFAAGQFSGENGVWQINQKSGRVINSYTVCGNQLAYDGSRLWVVNDDSRPFSLVALDPKSGEVLAVYPLDSNVSAISAGNGSVWLVLVKDAHYSLWTGK